MDIKEFAKMLNGRNYGNEILKQEKAKAEELGFVIVFGASDDLIEFEGAIFGEAGCFNGGKVLFDKDGILENCECECKYWEKAKEKAKVITAVWHDDRREEGYYWTYETDIPHETFDVIEYGEGYCRGIVFDIKELMEVQKC